MEFCLILSLIFTVTKGFMFDQLADKLRCQGISMLCPPMCLKLDPSGCSTCDCSSIDPSHPKIPGSGNTGGNNVDPSNPLSGHNKFPGSAECGDWTKCACVPTVNAASGCLECPCGQPLVPSTSSTIRTTQVTPVSKHIESKSTIKATTKATSSKTTQNHSPESQSSTMTSSNVTIRSSPLPRASVTPPYAMSFSTSKLATPAVPVVTKASTRVTSAKVTSPEVDTNLPNIATIPSMNSGSTTPATSTLAPFVCPGVFSCSLDCYAGFSMDKNGCPLCKCAPVPTDLP